MYGHSYISVHIVNSIQYMQNKVYHIYFSIPQIPRRPDSLSVVAYGYKVPHVTLQLSAAYVSCPCLVIYSYWVLAAVCGMQAVLGVLPAAYCK